MTPASLLNLVLTASIAMLPACLMPAYAQDYPQRPVRIVTSEPGGSLDFTARIVAHELAPRLGQPVIVENRGGGSGAIMAQTVAKASPDGHTLLFYGSALWTLPLLQTTPYDALRDFAPITAAARTPTILVVHPAVAVKSVSELIALAKTRRGELNYASSATGGSAHLAAELFKAMAGVDIVRVAYKGNGPAVNDLLGGQVQLMFSAAATVMPHVRSGKLRALAVSSAQPSPLLPDLPTVAASGLPGYEAVTVYAMFAPSRTLGATVMRINQEVVQLLSSPGVKEKFLNAGMEPVGSTSAQLATTMKTEIANLGKVIKSAGIRAE